jgi:tetratricopeptide (TPR) repeat protein
LYFAGARDDAGAYSRNAVERARASSDDSALAHALHSRRIVLWGPERLEERIAVTAELIGVGERAGELEIALDGRLWRIYALLETGDMKAVDQQIQEYSATAERLRQPSLIYYTHLLLAMRDLQTGRFEDAERVMEDALRLGRRAQSQNAEWFYTAQRYSLRRDRGGVEELVSQLRDLAERFPEIATWRSMLAAACAQTGDNEAALFELERIASGGLRAMPRDHLWMRNLASVAVACAAVGHAALAAEAYELLTPHAGQVDGDLATWNGPVTRSLGMLAATMRRHDDAVVHYERAIEACRRMGAAPWLAYGQFELGTVLLARGRAEDSPPAMSLFDQALDTARRLGMRPLMERILQSKPLLRA